VCPLAESSGDSRARCAVPRLACAVLAQRSRVAGEGKAPGSWLALRRAAQERCIPADTRWIPAIPAPTLPVLHVKKIVLIVSTVIPLLLGLERLGGRPIVPGFDTRLQVTWALTAHGTRRLSLEQDVADLVC
jgi:hypothetical protein